MSSQPTDIFNQPSTYLMAGAATVAELRHYKALVASLFDGVYFLDGDRRITYWNRAAELITGYPAHEVIGTRCSDNLLVHVDADGNSLCRDRCPVLAVIKRGEELETEAYLRHRDGHRLPVKIRVVPMRNADGLVTGAMEVFQDRSSIAALQREQQELEQLALIDPLTEIGNRRYLEIQLRAKIDEMQRYGWRFGLLFCDIDRFKRINDTFGHQVGDEVIRMVARTLSACLRPFDMVGRWGGEEFLAIVSRVRSWQLYAVAERLRAMVEQSVIHNPAGDIGATISVGAIIARPDEQERDLIARVDHLLYRSKAAGTNRVTVDEER